MSRYTNQMLASQPIGAPGAPGALGDSYRGGNGGEGYNAHTGDANGYYEAEPVDYDIYNRAIAVSSPREIGVEGDTNPGVVKKKVVRRVEVNNKIHFLSSYYILLTYIYTIHSIASLCFAMHISTCIHYVHFAFYMSVNGFRLTFTFVNMILCTAYWSAAPPGSFYS